MYTFRIYITLFFILLGSITLAQKVTMSPEDIEASGLNYVKVIGQDEDGFYLLHSNLSFFLQKDRIGLKSRKYQLSYFGFDMKPRWSKLLTPHPEEATIESVGFFNDRPFVMESNWSKSDNSLQLFLDVYDAKGNLFVQGKKIAAFTTSHPGDFEKPRSILSTSKNLLGIYLREDLDAVQNIHCVSIDTTYTPLKINAAGLPYADKDLDITDLALSDQNEFLLLAKLLTKDPVSEKKKLRLFQLFLLQPGSNKFKDYKVNDVGKNMSEAVLAIDKVNHRVAVTGFYSEKESFAGAGILFAILNLDNPDELKLSLNPITGDNQIKLVGERNNGNGISLFNYPVQKVILRNNGGAVIIAEAAYLSEYSYYDYFTQSFNRRVEYHFDNIVVFSVRADGSIEWTQVIRKDQASMDDEGLYSSFTYALNADEMIVVYNNDIGRNNEIVSYRINSVGQMTNKKLTKIGDNISLLPRFGRQVDAGRIVVPAINKKKLYLLKLDFEN